MSGTQLNLTGYKLTFDSEFADMTNSDFGLPGTPGIVWETQPFYGANGTNGANPIPPGQPGSLFSLQDGMLVENMDTNTTDSPYLDTNPNGVPGGFSQQYGYFEVNAKLAGVAGYNSDFWMMPNSGPWPPEMDVYEHNGYIPGDYEMTNHGGDANTPPDNLDLYNVPNLTTQFNTFGFMWTPTTLTWFINGQEVFSAPTASNENQPFNLILSGGPANVPWIPPPLAGTSDQYDIQWVHAYSNDPNATEIAGMTGYQNHDGSASLGSTSPPPPGPDPILITPGQGSFTDAAGNVYTLTTDDIAMENSQPMNGGAGTGEMEYADGIVYGQDMGSGTWYTWDQSINNWQLANSPPPPVTQGSGGTGSGGGSDGGGTGGSGGTTGNGGTGGTTGSYSPVTVGSGSDSLVLSVSENAYQGDAQFTVSVDGQQIGGTLTAQAPQGQDQTFTLNGDWGVGQHTVSIDFLNDLYGGTSDTDRNLYLDKAVYDGTDLNQSLQFWSQGSQSFTFNDTTPLPPPPVNPVPLAVPGAGSFVDAAGNVYTLDAQDNALENGQPMNGGAGTGQMEYFNGNVFASDFSSGTWYEWNQSLDNWVVPTTPPPANTATGSNPTTITMTGSQTQSVTVSESNIVLNLAGGNTITFAGSGSTINATGSNKVTDTGGHNTIVLGATGDTTLNANVLKDGDTFDLSQALKATSWDGNQNDLSTYLKTTTTGSGTHKSAVLDIRDTATGSWHAAATFTNSGALDLSQFLVHATT